MNTAETLMKRAIRDGMGYREDEDMDVELRNVALGAFNTHGRIIFDTWKWDNAKMDEFTAPDPDADGIITFASDVESIRALISITADGDQRARVWNEDELIAATNGDQVASDRFQHLADDSSGNRRILVDSDADAASYRVLARKRFIEAIIDPAYDPNDPSATPLDYRVMTFIIDRAEPALQGFMTDEVRDFDGRRTRGSGGELLKVARKLESEQSDRETRINPRTPQFSEMGDWRV
jgi:hypothetical protein